MLGAMLRHTNSSTQANSLAILSQKAKELEKRQARINMAREDYANEQRNKQSDIADGFITKILGIATGTGILFSGLTKVMDSFDANNIKNSKEGFSLLSKLDPKASKDEINAVLELIDIKAKEFDKALFKNRLAAYQFNYLEDGKAKALEEAIIEKLAINKVITKIDKTNEIINEISIVDSRR